MRNSNTPFRFALTPLLLVALTLLLSCNSQTPRDHSDLSGLDGAKTFSVASYNVENLFDQNDDSINQFYNAYRIEPNRGGSFSNYGDKVSFEGKKRSFTEIKLRGIYKTLIGLESGAPDIVCLQEIENLEVLSKLFYMLEDFGFVDWAYSDWSDWEEGKRQPINLGCLTKFPILDLSPIFIGGRQNQRPIMAMTVEVQGHPFTVYNNHWRSRAVPESARLVAGEALGEALKKFPKGTDYVVLGDLNSSYNENETISEEHNDTNGKTGINDGIMAHGNKAKVERGGSRAGNYNLNYEVPEGLRGTAYHWKWNNLDHMIVGPSSFDDSGIDYVDQSYRIASPKTAKLRHLFDSKDRPHRWQIKKVDKKESEHQVGGYSDHLPIFARFRVQ
jgi:endonuclease/exonuclease/phosphatase family metal-dependent hydrolase